MSRSLGCRWALPGLLFSLWLVAPAAAQTPDLHDPAGLFRPDTLQDLQARVLGLRQKYDVAVAVETVATYPADKAPKPRKGWLGWLDRFGKRVPSDAFFSQWAEERAKARPGTDLFLFFCREPLRVRVVQAGDKPPLLGGREVEGLRTSLQNSLRHGRPDAGLESAIEFVVGRAESRLRPQRAFGFEGSGPGLILVGLLGVWLLLVLTRPRKDARHDELLYGGARTGLLGAATGAQAGEWLYRLLLRPRPEPQPTTDAPAPAQPAQAEPANPWNQLQAPPLHDSTEDALHV
jgi:hypothetical protein